MILFLLIVRLVLNKGFKTLLPELAEAIVVTTPEMSAIRDADRIIGLLNAKEEIESTKLLLNRVRPNLIKNKRNDEC